jgi:hypothetical protein
MEPWEILAFIYLGSIFVGLLFVAIIDIGFGTLEERATQKMHWVLLTPVLNTLLVPAFLMTEMYVAIFGDPV